MDKEYRNKIKQIKKIESSSQYIDGNPCVFCAKKGYSQIRMGWYSIISKKILSNHEIKLTLKPKSPYITCGYGSIYDFESLIFIDSKNNPIDDPSIMAKLYKELPINKIMCEYTDSEPLYICDYCIAKMEKNNKIRLK